MEFQNKFDLEEFLAYLLPGFVCSFLLYAKLKTPVFTVVPTLNQYGPEYAILFFFIVFFVAISIILGHICSVFARIILRPLIYWILGDPAFSIFVSRQNFSTNKAFYSAVLINAISERFEKAFNLDMGNPLLESAVPRLIRAHVLLRAPVTAVARERIVRARSICANSVFPILLAMALFPSELGCLYAAILMSAAILLIVKEISLDVRESKEIYTAFLSVN